MRLFRAAKIHDADQRLGAMGHGLCISDRCLRLLSGIPLQFLAGHHVFQGVGMYGGLPRVNDHGERLRVRGFAGGVLLVLARRSVRGACFGGLDPGELLAEHAAAGSLQERGEQLPVFQAFAGGNRLRPGLLRGRARAHELLEKQRSLFGAAPERHRMRRAGHLPALGTLGNGRLWRRSLHTQPPVLPAIFRCRVAALSAGISESQIGTSESVPAFFAWASTVRNVSITYWSSCLARIATALDGAMLVR